MDRELIVEKTVKINAKPEEVWHALTSREMIKQYFFGTEAISDWKPGSTLIFQGEFDGKSYQDKGNILDAEPCLLLRYNYWSGFSGLEDIPENYSVVTYMLKADQDGTILTLTQEGFANKEGLAHAESGWTMVLENLKNLLEQT